MANTPESINIPVRIEGIAETIAATLRLGPLLAELALQILDPQEPTDDRSRKVAQAADAVRDLLA